MNNILVLSKNIEDYKKEFNKKNFPDLKIHFAESIEEANKYIHNINIILGNPNLTSQILHNAQKLEWVQSTFAGVDSLCKQKLRKDYILTGVKGIFGPLISEYVFAYILSFERNLFEMKNNQLNGNWLPLSYRNVSELTIGIAGLGSIGKHVAKTASHFGMHVLGLKNTFTKVDYVDEVFESNNIESFLKNLDYLILTLPSTPATKHLINSNTLNMMKKSAFLINAGRGSVVDEKELINALNSNTISSAVLDVFENEPLSEESPLWSMNNVHITPHISAISFPRQIVKIFEDNYLRFVKKAPLKHIIDFNKGY